MSYLNIIKMLLFIIYHYDEFKIYEKTKDFNQPMLFELFRGAMMKISISNLYKGIAIIL